MMRRGITLSLSALLLQVLAVRAAPLDKEGCATLKAEEASLEEAGTRQDMRNGPQWAKLNLAPEKLEQIRRLLEVEEQLRFRCHGKPLVNLPQDPDPDPAATADDDKEPPAKAAKPPKAQKKDPKKATARAADQAVKASSKEDPAAKKSPPPPGASPARTEDGAGKKAADKATAARKSKSKAKVDDAYRAPAWEPGANPFAHQVAPKQ